jgi:hypothetical protein
MDTAGDECEGRTALHGKGITRVMRQHEDRSMVRRFRSPLALPGLVPLTSNGSEHVAAHDDRPGAVQ